MALLLDVKLSLLVKTWFKFFFLPYCASGGSSVTAWRRRTLGICRSGVPRGGGVGVQTEIPKALHNRAKLNPIVKTVKNG